MISGKPLKPRCCRQCRNLFSPRNSFQVCCGIECSIEAARIAQARKAVQHRIRERRVHKVKLDALMTRRDWIKKAQKAFNAFIRARDKDKPCICCDRQLRGMDGKFTTGGGFDCGHYRSIGSAPQHRYNPDNAAAQKKQCNRYGAGRAVDYRIGLIKRIGLKRVEVLENDNAIRKYTIPDLQAIEATYKQKLKELT